MKLTIKWNEDSLQWEMFSNLEGYFFDDYVPGTVFSINPNNNGSNPPCEGWSNGYSLEGDICISYPDGIPDYIYRPPSPQPNIVDEARKGIILQPGTLIDAQQIGSYKGVIKKDN